jgi:hypothetical protein
VSGIISGAVDWITSHWAVILAILTGPFGLLVGFVRDHFNQIVNFLSGIPGGYWPGSNVDRPCVDRSDH